MAKNLELIFPEQNIQVNVVSETTGQAELLFTITAKSLLSTKVRLYRFQPGNLRKKIMC